MAGEVLCYFLARQLNHWIDALRRLKESWRSVLLRITLSPAFRFTLFFIIEQSSGRLWENVSNSGHCCLYIGSNTDIIQVNLKCDGRASILSIIDANGGNLFIVTLRMVGAVSAWDDASRALA